MCEASFHLICTNGLHKRFIAPGPCCRQSFHLENFTSSFGRKSQRNTFKLTHNVLGDRFFPAPDSTNQSLHPRRCRCRYFVVSWTVHERSVTARLDFNLSLSQRVYPPKNIWIGRVQRHWIHEKVCKLHQQITSYLDSVGWIIQLITNSWSVIHVLSVE